MTNVASKKSAIPSYTTLLLICCGVAFGGFLGSHMRLPVVPLYARSLGADAVLVGIINAAFLLMAALLLEADQSLSPDGVYAVLESTAPNMNDLGLDFDSGFGFIQAYAVVDEVSTPNEPPTVSSLSPKSGPTEGSNEVVIVGIYLTGATAGSDHGLVYAKLEIAI